MLSVLRLVFFQERITAMRLYTFLSLYTVKPCFTWRGSILFYIGVHCIAHSRSEVIRSLHPEHHDTA